MGANAQTSVPTFTAGQVLTAAQMNESARTGVPVFADSTARDAAFGGTGEKTLAEGQLVYLEDSNIVQYYDGSSWATLGPAASLVSASTQTNSAQGTTSTSYTDLATVTSVTLTTGSTAFCVWHYSVTNGGSNVGVWGSVAVSGATTVAASDTIANYFQSPSTSIGLYAPASSGHIFTSLTPGSNTFTMKYRTGSGTATFDTRGIQVIAL